MALNSEQIGTPLTPMSEGRGSFKSCSRARRTSRLVPEVLGERRASKASIAQSAGNSKTVGAPPVAAEQSLVLGSPSSSARPLESWIPDGSSQGSRLMALKFPFSLPIFAGTDMQDFRTWMDLFDRAMLACGDLPGGERLRYLGVFLEGPAYRVLKGCGVGASYDAVVAALKDTFLTPEVSRLAAVKFLSRVQVGTETVLEYADTLSGLIETAYPSVPAAHLDGLLRDRFLSGVLPIYQGWLRFQSCDTFQAAIACGRKVEIIMQSDPAIKVPDVQAEVRHSTTTEKNSVSVMDHEV
ncbi:MAG: hypothetical protein GY696_39335, partial [Gammaproteobacteria bacterium]|nr:hypothetical protein [Gammaproteobacteria bacterium]